MKSLVFEYPTNQLPAIRMTKKVMKWVLPCLLCIFALNTNVQAFELNSNCYINVLNRTVQVSEDGGWSLPNVPSFMGRVRARATCIQDGETITGESGYFNVVENEIVEVGQINFVDPEPIPESLSFSSSSIPLSGVGDTYQTTVTATFADGSLSDYTQSPGINFFSSNPDIVTVDQSGSITAIGSGNGLITARLESGINSGE